MLKTRAWVCVGLLLAAVGCEERPAVAPVAEVSESAMTASVSPSAKAATSAHAASGTSAAPAPAPAAMGSTAVSGGTPCGELDCRHFDEPADAFEAVLALSPRVIAIGEAHAQRGTEEIDSATKRFREQLLPLAKGSASDLVLELMIADGKCKQTEKKVAKVQKPVVQRQAQGNQNEFTALGHASKALEIRPHVLRPSCEDYKAVVKAGPDGIDAMLTMIAALSEDLLKRILARNQREKRDKLVLAYGGAMHNDMAPRAGREKWSFGPAMSKATGGRYIEIDLIVPEFIKDNDTWRALPWHSHFKPDTAPDKVTLYRTGDSSFTLIFARSTKGAPSP